MAEGFTCPECGAQSYVMARVFKDDGRDTRMTELELRLLKFPVRSFQRHIDHALTCPTRRRPN